MDLAEEKSEELKKAVAAISEDTPEADAAEVELQALAADDAATNTEIATKACTDFLTKHQVAMKKMIFMLGAQVSEGMSASDLMKRVTTIKASQAGIGPKIASYKAKASCRARAAEAIKAVETTFKKYDKDKDSLLSRAEVAVYAASEFGGLVLPKETLDKLWKSSVEDGKKGMTKDDFRFLRVACGVARETERDNKRKIVEAEKRKALDKIKAKLQDKVKNMAKVVDAADKEVAKCEQAVQPLSGKIKTSTHREMQAMCSQVEDGVAAARKAAMNAQKAIEAINDGVAVNLKAELKELLRSDPVAKKAEMTVKRMESRFSRILQIVRSVKEESARKELRATAGMRKQVVQVFRLNAKLREQTTEEVFDSMDTNADGQVDEAEFLRWFAEAEKDLQGLEGENAVPKEEVKPKEEDVKKEEVEKDEVKKEEEEVKKEESDEVKQEDEAKAKIVELTDNDLKAVFSSLCGVGSATLAKDTFVRLARICFTIVKPTVIGVSLAIADAESVGRLVAGDVVELLEGPLRDETANIMRIRCKSLAGADLTGWVSTAGNQGTVFTKEGGSIFKVAKESVFSPDFDASSDKIEDADKTKAMTRKLKVGEVLDLIEGPRKNAKTHESRIKCRARIDGTIGWTTSIAKGIAFVKSVA